MISRRRTVWVLALACLAQSGCSAPRTFSANLTDTRSTVQASLTDDTGFVRDLQFVHPVPDWAMRAEADLKVANADDRSVQIRWTGGTCPSKVALTTTSQAAGILVELDPGAQCQEDVGKIRVIEILFDHPVPAQSVDVRLQPAASPSL